MRKTFTLKELRAALGQTQETVATHIGIDRALYSHYENGIRTPNVHVAKRIAGYFDVAVEQINFFNSNDTQSHKEDSA